ncbi:MAG: NifB/NifX family molybdenum-iron cluster-binding protein [Phycisphaerae bacterium]|nr:NifB/NifX family molybdenum-iron cluster-binding protein [Phycisphaerae bacterium]
MIIAVAATGGSLDAQVSEQFGRAQYFLIVDAETLRFEAFSNPAASMAGGAGPAAVQEITKRKAEVVLAGKLGPNAQQALTAAGIRFSEATGKVRDAVAAYGS